MERFSTEVGLWIGVGAPSGMPIVRRYLAADCKAAAFRSESEAWQRFLPMLKRVTGEQGLLIKTETKQ